MKSSGEMLESEDDLLCDVRQGNRVQSPKDVGNKSRKELGLAEVWFHINTKHSQMG